MSCLSLLPLKHDQIPPWFALLKLKVAGGILFYWGHLGQRKLWMVENTRASVKLKSLFCALMIFGLSRHLLAACCGIKGASSQTTDYFHNNSYSIQQSHSNSYLCHQSQLHPSSGFKVWLQQLNRLNRAPKLHYSHRTCSLVYWQLTSSAVSNSCVLVI